MTVAQLLAQLRERDIRVWSQEGRLRYDAPSGALTEALRLEITTRREALLRVLERGAAASRSIERIPRTNALTLSYGQQRLWFIDQINRGNLAYNVPATVRMRGSLDTDALIGAIDGVVRRHETLRASFPAEGGAPRVVIAPPTNVGRVVESLESLPEAERLDAARRYAHQSASSPFDLARGPLVRFALMRLAPEDHVLHVCMHHTISDGWSMGVFFRELDALYRGETLPELAVQYVDYAHWQREELESGRRGGLEHWKRLLAGAPTLDLPTDRPRPSVQSHIGAYEWREVPEEVYRRLRELARSEEATIFQVLFGAFAALLAQTTGQDDVVIGTPVAGRSRRELEPLIGFFVNTIVLRADVTSDPTFRELLARVRPMALDAFAHQDVPFEKVVDEIQPERDFGRNPIFQVLFNHYNLQQYIRTLGPLKLESLNTSLPISKFDLTLHCYEDRGRLVTKFEFATDLFSAESIERLGRHYGTLLKAIGTEPDRPLSRLPLMDADERHEVLVEWNRLDGDRPEDEATPTFLDRFAQQVRLRPDAPALGNVSFRTLDERTDRIARALRRRGVGADDRVVLRLERSPDVIVAIVAVMKAGGAYVPVDPGLPDDRAAFVIEDSGAQLVLDADTLAAFEDEAEDGTALPVVEPGQLAYVIYTSGSTGQPKGVALEHAQLAAYLDAILPQLELAPGTRCCTVSTFAADVGHTVIFPALAAGGVLHVMPEDAMGDADAFAAFMREHAIDLIKIVPSHLDALLAAASQPADILPSTLLVTGGEALTWELVERVRALAPECAILNHYGPTETTVGVLTCRIGVDGRERFPIAPPIGRPLAGVEVYLLDRRGEPVPVGAIGELCVGGHTVARGYLGRPELTADRFVENTFRPGGRLYRTGDLARYTSDGHVFFMGRRDDQVKLRGFRVELGEVQTAIERYPEVGSCVVVVREDDPGVKHLVAYVTADNDTVPAPSDIRVFLSRTLPEYMVPSAIVALDRIPLTTNGKVDRRALPTPEPAAATTEFVAPRTPTEATLARIWADVLRVKAVGIHDDFFDLGGDSILSIQIISRAGRAGLRLTPRDLFEHPTVAELARVVSSVPAIEAEQGPVTGPVPLTPIERRYFDQDPISPHHYNHAMLLTLRRAIAPETLGRAVERVIEHHDALRLRFTRHDDGTWTQEIAPDAGPAPFTSIDLSGQPAAERSALVEARAGELQASLDLAEGPLVRVAQFHLGDGEPDRVLIAVHHAAIDGVSWRILLEDLELACDEAASLPPKTTSVKAWAEHLVTHADDEATRVELPYWRDVAERCHELRLPHDHVPAPVDLTAAAVSLYGTALDADETRALLREVPRAYRTQINDVLLAALTASVGDWTGADAVRIDLEGHGREDLFSSVDLTRTIGWFTTVYPVMLSRLNADDRGALLKSIKEQLRGVPRRGIGWGLLKHLAGGDEVSAIREAPAGELTFNYLGQFDQMFEEAGLFVRAAESSGRAVDPRNPRTTLIDVTASMSRDRLRVNWVYNDRVYERSTVEALAAGFLAELRAIIAHCTLPDSRGATPSDFPLARLTQTEVDRIGDHHSWQNVEDIALLSPLQEGMIYHTLSEPESAAYVTQMALTLVGELDVDALHRAWQRVTDLHPVLRTAVIVSGTSRLHQVVCRHADVRWSFEDWRETEPETQRERLSALAVDERRRGVDLETPPLMRLRLIRIADDRFRFVWTHHHVLLDGWSLPLLMRDVFEAYAAERDGRPAKIVGGRPFFDYLRWLERQDRDEAQAYWQQLLEGWHEPTPLPFRDTAHRAGDELAVCSTRRTELTLETTEALQRFARDHQLTPNTVVLGAWSLLLSAYSGEQDVLFGATVAGRPADLPDVERMLGMFINTLPMRVRLGDENLIDWLRRLQSQQLDLQRFDFTALYEIQRHASGGGHNRLFDSIFVFENFPMTVRSAPGSSRAARGFGIEEGQDVSFANYPLAAVIRPAASLSLELRYDQRFFADETIGRVLEHFRALLESFVACPDTALDAVSLVTPGEREQIMIDWNGTATDYPRTETVDTLFARQAAETPDAPAATYGDASITYRALDERAEQLADFLAAEGVGRGTLVAVCVERGIDLVTAMLGILKAGAAYVPLDPDQPATRLTFMLEDIGSPILLTHEALLDRIPSHAGRTVCLERDRAAIDAAPRRVGAAEAGPDDLAYVIYTSGSTGRPKGSCIPHRAIVRLVRDTDYVQLDRNDRVAQAANASFDAATFEIWGPLLTGGQIIGVGRDEALSPQRFAEAIRERRITVLFLTTALFNQLSTEIPDIFAPLRCLLFGGEAVDPGRVRAVLADGAPERLLHVYGPTENTTFSTWHEVTAVADDARTVPIGRPIANSTAYVLDHARRPVPIGAPGELYVGGDGVALGYLNDAGLTADRFVPDPSGDPGRRLYRTGDLVRQRPDGAIEFIGRVDHQVKLRGFRIELGEVEAALLEDATVREAVVLCREDEPGEKQLVAYVVADGERPPSRDELRRNLADHLPDYMVPSAVIFLDAMPLNVNGKIDRRALPAPTGERDVTESFIAPRSELETQLAAIWSDVLGLDRVGVRDNFFDLGGHSLRLLQVHGRLVEELECDLTITDLFEHSTIESLAAQMLGGAAPQPALQHEAEARQRRRGETASESIAIVAMHGRFPGATGVDALWRNLLAGVEGIRVFTEDELREAGVDEARLADPSYVKARGVIDDVDLFDAWFFGYSPREAELIDPQHRVFLECAWEVLEAAGYDAARYEGMIGVYAGVTMNTYVDNLRSQPELLAAAGGIQGLISTDKDFLATRVSYKLNLRGPSMNVQTACSTSLVAVHEACRSLLDHQCDIALAGGVTITVPVVQGYVYQKSSIRSPDGHCRAFDARAQGTVPGNGVAILALKRLSEAVRDGDQIRAVIRGTAVNNDGAAKVGFTAPSIEGQADVIALAQAAAGIDPDTIGYVEAHGTGTALGDPIEMAALNKVFCERTARKRFCAIGSIKSNLGHLNDAAGATGLIKAALTLEHGAIPATLHYEAPNPEIDFEASPFFVAAERRPFAVSGSTPRRAAVSSFGLGGTNAHAVLEEAPPRPPSSRGREQQLLVLSAKTASALDAAAANLAQHLREHGDPELADVVYTLQTGRREFEHRRAVLGRTPGDVIAGLEGVAGDRVWTRHAADCEHPVVFMFPGQGAQYVDMARRLYDAEPVFRATVDECLTHLDGELNFDLRSVLYPSDDARSAAPDRLRHTSAAQPALFVVEYALAQLWRSWGIEPVACIGHSIGEYTAACVSGVLKLADALRLVAARGRLMESMPSGVMLAVPLDETELRRRLAGEHGLWIASLNAPSMCVVSGTEERIAAFERALMAEDIEGKRLHTSHAFHSGLMEAAVAPFVEIAKTAEFGTPKIPYPSNVTGDWITAETAHDPHYWGRHIREPVRFADGIGLLLENPDHVLLEVGPGQVLGALSRMHLDCGPDRVVVSSLRAPQVETEDDAFLTGALGRLWTAGVTVDWKRFHAGESRRRVALPTYPFDRQRFWVERKATTAARGNARRRLADWGFVRVWRRTPRPPIRDETGPVLLFDDGRIGPALVDGLARAGRRVVTVRTGDAFSRTEDNYTIDPEDLAHYADLVADLARRDVALGDVVHTWSDPIEDLPGFFSLLSLGRALGDAEITSPIRISVITDRVHEVTGEEEVQPEAATSLGPCRVLGLEFPNVSCRNIDVAATEGEDHSYRDVVTEIGSAATDAVVAYRRGRRWVESFAPVPLPGTESDPPPRLRRKGTYLITGGLGGIGLALANDLARTVGANLVLTGRRTPNEDDRAHIAALEAAGAHVMVASVDVTDGAAMRDVLAQARARYGRVHGIIHAAGVPGSGLVVLKERAQAERVLAPKVDGTRVLAELAREGACGGDPDFVVLCSSLNAVKGAPGFVDYCAANAYLDAFARRFAVETGICTISINWNRWCESGMAVKAHGGPLRRALGITNAEGAETFRRVLAGAPDAQVLISEYDLHATLTEARPSVDGDVDAEGDSTGTARGKEPASGRRKAYPRPNVSTEFVAPETELERRFAEIWCTLFGIDAVGVNDDFFELGGHSLLATQLLNRAKQAFPGVELSLRTIFDNATIGKLVRLVECAEPSKGAAGTGAVPLERRSADIDHRDVDALSDEEVDDLLDQLLEDGRETR